MTKWIKTWDSEYLEVVRIGLNQQADFDEIKFWGSTLKIHT